LSDRLDEEVVAVPRKVLKEQYEGRLEPDEIEADQEFSNDDDEDFETYDAGNQFIRESAASPPASNIEGTGKGDNLTKDSPNVNAKSPAHKSNGLDFGEFACLLGVTAQIPRLVCKDK
jgi:hypothetical protein